MRQRGSLVVRGRREKLGVHFIGDGREREDATTSSSTMNGVHQWGEGVMGEETDAVKLHELARKETVAGVGSWLGRGATVGRLRGDAGRVQVPGATSAACGGSRIGRCRGRGWAWRWLAWRDPWRRGRAQSAGAGSRRGGPAATRLRRRALETEK
jgi:hypothetical protein